MAEIRPFRALRYGPDVAPVLEQLVSPPGGNRVYPRSGLDGTHPYNILRLVRGRFDPANEGDGEPYRATQACLHEWKQRGVLVRDPEPAFYVWEQTFDFGRERLTQRGLVGHVHLEPLGKRNILPHERTLRGPKPDLLDQLRALETNLSLTMTLMDDPTGQLRAALADPPDAELLAEVVDGLGVTNRTFRVRDPEFAAEIQRTMAGQPLVIADGHHRYEIALAYQRERRRNTPARGASPWDYVMMLVVPTEQANRSVKPAHRVLRNLPPGWREQLDAQLKRYFVTERFETIEALEAFVNRGRLPRQGLVMDGSLTGVRLRRNKRVAAVLERQPAAWRHLEITVVRAILLREVIGVSPDVYADKEHTLFPTSAEAVESAIHHDGFQLGILVRPTPAPLVTGVARSGNLMPPKSTHFYPKPTKGLIMNSLKGF
jgi:uncharacterized protein (DUF1015 family)